MVCRRFVNYSRPTSLNNDETTQHAGSSERARSFDCRRRRDNRFPAARHHRRAVDRCPGRPRRRRRRRAVEDAAQLGAGVRRPGRAGRRRRAGQADRPTGVLGQEERHVVAGPGRQQGDTVQVEQQQHGGVGQAYRAGRQARQVERKQYGRLGLATSTPLTSRHLRCPCNRHRFQYSRPTYTSSLRIINLVLSFTLGRQINIPCNIHRVSKKRCHCVILT